MAFKLADRRCRILPAVEPHCYVLRAEASFQMGARTAAVADIAKALEIVPDNIVGNRRMLAWSNEPQQKIRAAFALIRTERNYDSLRSAIRFLRQNGQRNLANVRIFADSIEGWAVWEKGPLLTISISDDAQALTNTFEPDAFHPLAEYGQATDFVLPRPKSTGPQSIQLSVSDSVIYSARSAGNEIEPKSRVHRPKPVKSSDQHVTVIVPVYGDYEATKLCLETLLDELRSSHHRALIIDDASPEPRIAKYLRRLSAEPNVDVATNANNRGFIGSINRAFAHIKQGDVILLNSDTIVPSGFIDRLAAAARSSPDIGTVTPLSNNGEFTSFPLANISNPLCSYDEIERIDAIAAKTNAGKFIDIPSGIGFCLYITRKCLDSVGPLSEDFTAGYLEDADFCLRAREKGYRSVCAPSVYIGHAGSKSFKDEKRSLVLRNASVLEKRFPKHSSECAAFIAADPLKTAREAIERSAAAIPSHPRLLVTGAGTISTIARQRARELASEPCAVMILEVHYRADGTRIKIIDAAGGIPQSVQFNLALPHECRSLTDFIQSIEPSRIEFLDPANSPFQLVDLLLARQVPYDIFIADAGLAGVDNAQRSAAAVRSLPGRYIDKVPSRIDIGQTRKDYIDRWHEIAGGAARILAPCPQAEAFAESVYPERAVDTVKRAAENPRRVARKTKKAASGYLGLVPLRCSAHEQVLMSEVARRFNKLRPSLAVTIIGAALDDIGLMRSTNAFVTGAVNTEEFEREVSSLSLGYLFICATQPVFGHPIYSAAESSALPLAYFDWSTGRIKPKKMDLPIDPGSSIDDIIRALDRWIAAS